MVEAQYYRHIKDFFERVKAYIEPDDHQLPAQIVKAFFQVPRHKFVGQVYHPDTYKWITVSEKPSKKDLDFIYTDSTLLIWPPNKKRFSRKKASHISTMSQPSVIFKMLKDLDLRAGQKVFEVGTGSGWTAALISELVGPRGEVTTSEILSPLANRAAQRLRRLGFDNVKVLDNDGYKGVPGKHFDRIIFHAASWAFPVALFEQTRPGAKVLFIFKNKGGWDDLYILERKKDHFKMLSCEACNFIPNLGALKEAVLEEKLKNFLATKGLKKKPVESRDFPLGNKIRGPFPSLGQKYPVVSALTIQESFVSFFRKSHGFFGWYDEKSNSLAVAKDGKLFSYGSTFAARQLVKCMREWVDYGMPTLENLELKIYRHHKGKKWDKRKNWVSLREQCALVWKKPKNPLS